MIQQKEILLKLSLLGSHSERDREQVNQDVGCFFLKHRFEKPGEVPTVVTAPSPPHRRKDHSLGEHGSIPPPPGVSVRKLRSRGSSKELPQIAP